MILGCAAQHLRALLPSLTPSTNGLILVGAEGEEEANQRPVGNSDSNRLFPVLVGREGLCSISGSQVLKTLWGLPSSGLGGGQLHGHLVRGEGEKAQVGEVYAWVVWGESGHRQARDSVPKGLEG